MFFHPNSQGLVGLGGIKGPLGGIKGPLRFGVTHIFFKTALFVLDLHKVQHSTPFNNTPSKRPPKNSPNIPKYLAQPYAVSHNNTLKNTTTPWKFNSSPLKIYHPKRKAIIFQGKLAVKLRGGYPPQNPKTPDRSGAWEKWSLHPPGQLESTWGICVNLTQTYIAHRIHGTGIFTYI